MLDRRLWLQSVLGSIVAGRLLAQGPPKQSPSPLKITALRITPIALPDPPLLAASGCHGPYFLRNIVQLETDAKVVGIAETVGGERATNALEKARPTVVGQNAFA